MTPEHLARYGILDGPAALHSLKLLDLDAKGSERVLAALGRSAEPDQGLILLERFIHASPAPRSSRDRLLAEPRALELASILCGGSAFLAESLMREPTWFEWAFRRLGRPRSREEIARSLSKARDGNGLRVAKRRELFLIGARDLLRLATVEETLSALTTLAEVSIGKACELSAAGRGFAVIALGKLGGGELNFSSDVDLLYLVSPSLARGDRARRLAWAVTAALGEVTSEGHVYRVDLRLRPEGSVGEIAPTLASVRRYYRDRASSWERLALIKARPVAGDHALGSGFPEAVRAFVFGRPFDREELDELREAKRRMDLRLLARGEADRNVKLGFGGIREIEFVTHSLQLRFAGRRKALRERSTLGTLSALRETGLLPAEQAEALSQAYLFLRDVENKLQIAAGAHTHTLPSGPMGMRSLARRLGYGDTGGMKAEAAFLRDYQSVTKGVHQIFRQVFG
ncbi:MAG TPA: hypothetical protein VIE88_03330 [Vicinamibacteria bacterium]|jgi:glutamate-ammonia-ligase adenylyltransferase